METGLHASTQLRDVDADAHDHADAHEDTDADDADADDADATTYATQLGSGVGDSVYQIDPVTI